MESGEEGEGGLFRERQPLSFFAVDCRPKEQVGLSGAYYCERLRVVVDVVTGTHQSVSDFLWKGWEAFGLSISPAF